MKQGTTIYHPKNLTCPDCDTDDIDKKVITEARNGDILACVRYKCMNCNCVRSSLPFRVIEPLNEEVEEYD